MVNIVNIAVLKLTMTPASDSTSNENRLTGKYYNMFCHSFKKNTQIQKKKSCGGGGLRMALFTMYLTVFSMQLFLPFIISANKIYSTLIKYICIF